MLLRWLKDGTTITTIARDAKVSPATGYRYIHEALTVVAEKSPTLIEALQQVTDKDEPFICLDGTLIHTDRIAQRNLKTVVTCGTQVNTKPSAVIFKSSQIPPDTQYGFHQSPQDQPMILPLLVTTPYRYYKPQLIAPWR